MGQADDEAVERGPLGLKDRSALRDDRYRRWLWGTRLLLFASYLSMPLIVPTPGVMHVPAISSAVPDIFATLPLTIAIYVRALMHVQLKGALVGTRLSKFKFRRLVEPDPIESESESMRIAFGLGLLGTVVALIPLLV